MAMTWRTVRVFVSSTFRDMHAERDYLGRIVFPELRERCVKRKLHLVDLDLRWGVTEEEAEQGKVLEIILDEINRSRPFFIAILGERYGSVLDEVPEDVESAYAWLRDYHDHSLTALEIMHGVLRNPDLARRSFFYFRDPKIISQIPESRRIDFVAKSPEAARKLARLKNKILVSGRPVMENYPCRWDNAVGRLVDLEAFGRQVLEDLWTAICTEYPEEAPEADPLTIERQIHEAFAEERSRLHVGRLEEAARLTQYVQGTDRRPVVITGESGCGKSAFLANWHQQYASQHPDDFVLAYFIGASPDSTNYHRLLRNMCGELKRRFALAEEIPQDDKRLSEVLAAMLTSTSRGEVTKASFSDRLRRVPPKPMSGRRIVIVIDALNQLLPLEAAHGLGWLLDYMPEKVRLVVSSLEGDCLDILRRRGAEEVTLPPLSVDEQRQIVQALLGLWRRKLDDRQLAALLAHQMVKNPLYLRVALEELRLFGRYEQLTERIKTLAEDILGLFDQVLARLEEDHGHELVAEAFAVLGCSRYGLSEAELLDLLRQEEQQRLPRALWARLARNARAYLVQRGEFFGFFHQQMGDAVAKRYLSQDNRHAKLAAYFEHAPLERKVDEYPYQLQHAEQWQALATALSDLDFFEYAWNHEREYDCISYWQSLKGRFEPGACYQAAIEAKEKEEDKATVNHFLLVGWFLRDIGKYSAALAFSERALAISESSSDLHSDTLAASLFSIAESYKIQGRYAEAEALCRRALNIYQRTLPNHINTATCLHSLAIIYYEQGKDDEALPICQQAIVAHERLLGSDKILNSDVTYLAGALATLAQIYVHARKYDEALPLYQRALIITERVMGRYHPDTANILHHLANFHQLLGHYSEAEVLYHDALSILQQVLGQEHRLVSACIADLGMCARAQARYDEAVSYLQHALDIAERTMGPDHIDTAAVLIRMAGLREEQGRFAQALPLYQRALAILEHVLEPVHPKIAHTLAKMADLYYSERKYDEAVSLCQRALSLYQQVLGSESPEVANSLVRLALTYHAQGKYGQALSLFKRASTVLEHPTDPENPSVAIRLLNMAIFCSQYNRYSNKALSFCQRALKICEKTVGSDHPLVARTLSTMAYVHFYQDKHDKALTLWERALSITERVLGQKHPDVASVLVGMATVFYYKHKYTRALDLLQRALAIQKGALGDNNPDTANTILHIANIYYSQGRYAEALPPYQEALRIFKQTLGSGHPSTAIVFNSMGQLYYMQGKYAEAMPLFKRAVEIAVAHGSAHPNTKLFRKNLKACQNAMR